MHTKKVKTKSFKDYDKKYAYLSHQPVNEAVRRAALNIKRWKYFELLTIPSQVEVQYAVYESDTAEYWQKFRVSLHGLTTQEKLLLLQNRYSKMLEMEETFYRLEAKLERTRIDNYIGALRRGGFLNSKGEVVK